MMQGPIDKWRLFEGIADSALLQPGSKVMRAESLAFLAILVSDGHPDPEPPLPFPLQDGETMRPWPFVPVGATGQAAFVSRS
ncbi:hypothetical protein ASF39_11490 [Methylobacterium sp. Leaf108]|nr:hypothetical protein ASF39_11490 [Methylobacterium sp. Leaf108]